MRAERIIELIDEAYPKVKDLVTMTGMDKGGWVVAALKEAEMGEHKHFMRCENCIFNECEMLQNLKEEYWMIVEAWLSHGVNCSDFSPKPDADGVM